MMLSWFAPSELPNGGYKQHLQSDESTYRKIYDAAKGIETQCTQTRNPGWAQIGRLLHLSELCGTSMLTFDPACRG